MLWLTPYHGQQKIRVFCASIVVTVASWKEDLKASYVDDNWAEDLFAQEAILGALPADYTNREGLLVKEGRYYVGSSTNLRNKIIETLHNGLEGGHSGVQATVKRIDARFVWPELKKDVSKWVSECDICQRNKSEHVPSPGLLQTVTHSK